jgi:hypothetical protein
MWQTVANMEYVFQFLLFAGSRVKRRLAMTNSLSSVMMETICVPVNIADEKPVYFRYLLSILTAHVKKAEPEMDRALRRIKELRGKVMLWLNSENYARPLSTFRVKNAKIPFSLKSLA